MRVTPPFALRVASAGALLLVGLGMSGPEPVPGSAPQRNPGDIIFWCAVLLVTAFVMGGAFFFIRKKLMAEEDQPAAVSVGFTLSDLRQMHSEGQLSDEEFAAAKEKMIATAKAKLNEAAEDAPDEPAPIVTNLGDITDRPAGDDPAAGDAPTDNIDDAGDAGSDDGKNGPET